MENLDISKQIEIMQNCINEANEHLQAALKAQVSAQEAFANIEQLIAKP
jgi:hypothetical protein